MMHITNTTATMGDSLAWLPRNLTEQATNTGSLILWGSGIEPRMERRVVAVGTNGEPGMVVRFVDTDGRVSMRQFGDAARQF